MSPLLIALLIYVAILVGTLVYALLKGGTDERSGAITLLVLALLSQIFSMIGPGGKTAQGWGGPEIDVMVIDAAGFIAFVAIAYRSKRFWPIWAAASQFVAVVTHWVVILNPSIVRAVYATAQPFWVFPVIVALIVGTRSHHKSVQHKK